MFRLRYQDNKKYLKEGIMSNLKTAWGKGIAVAMAAALIVSAVPGTDASAAKKAKLAKKTLTVKVGKTAKIKIKNRVKKAKYTFKSKKAATASVNKKGVVKGKKAGSTKITVTEKKGKKSRKVGVVKVNVKGGTPVVTPAPVQPTVTPVPNTPATSVPGVTASNAPTGAPNATTAPSKAPTAVPTVKPTKPPTAPPTDKPTPKPDAYTPSAEGGWQKLDLSQWSGGEGNFLETGDQFVLSDTELETVPLPTPLENLNDKIEVLIRGSVSKDSDGFRFWLANEGGATRSGQYHYTLADGEIYKKGSSSSDMVVEEIGEYKPGESFHIQTVLENVNWDNDSDIVCTRILLKAFQYGATLDGVTITGIWVRYGDKIGTTVETPDIKDPGVDTPNVDTSNADTSTVEEYTIDFDADYKTEGGEFDLKPTIADGVITATFAGGFKGFQYMVPNTKPVENTKFSTVTITYTNPGADLLFYLYDGKTDLAKPNLGQQSPNKHQIESGLPKTAEEKTITFKASDYPDLSGSIRGLHVFGYEANTTCTIKSIVFKK